MKIGKVNKIDHLGVNRYFISKDKLNNLTGYDLMTSYQGFTTKCYWLNSNRVGFIKSYNIRFKI